jgi:hypothetical protein
LLLLLGCLQLGGFGLHVGALLGDVFGRLLASFGHVLLGLGILGHRPTDRMLSRFVAGLGDLLLALLAGFGNVLLFLAQLFALLGNVFARGAFGAAHHHQCSTGDDGR